MAKALEATCSAGIVKVGSLVISNAVVLSEGNAPSSSGVLFIDEDKSYYVASSATDLKKLIENVAEIIDKLSMIVTGLDAATTSPGSQAASIIELALLNAQLSLTKDTLI